MNLFLYSIMRLTIGLLLILIGLIGLILPWSAAIQSALIKLILDDAALLALFGTTLIVIGSTLVLYAMLNMKRRSYCLKSDSRALAIDEAVFEQYISLYWKERFPDIEIPWLFQLRKGVAYISADFPALPLEEQRPFLEKLKNELETLLREKIGYSETFYLYASFKTS